MITVKSAKKTLTGNFEINGYCLIEDEKPTENIANGSKLWELNSGDKYVFDEENTEWIKLKTGGGSVKTEVYTGTLDVLFDVSNLKTYSNALNNGAIGIITSDNMSGVNMALNIISNPQQDNSNIVVAGTGLQGYAFWSIGDLIDTSDNWPHTFETGSEFANFILPLFDELGLNIMMMVDGISGSNPKILFAGVYVNTPASNGPHFFGWGQTSLIQNLGSFTLTFYYMGNTQPTIIKEVLTGPLSTIFSDNGYTEEQFQSLVNDVAEGRATVSVPMAMGNISVILFASVINSSLLQISSTMRGNNPANFTAYYYWDLTGEDYEVCCHLMMLTENSSLQHINDSFLNNLTGQDTYNFTITRITEA